MRDFPRAQRAYQAGRIDPLNVGAKRLSTALRAKKGGTN